MPSSPEEQDEPKFPWDSLLSNPGLSRLVTDIFLGTDMETFCNLERVCRAWRDHIIGNFFTLSQCWVIFGDIIGRITSI